MPNNKRFKERAFFDPRFVRTESRRVYRLAFLLFWSVLLAGLYHRYVVSLGIITDRSMMPLFLEGNYYLVNRYIYTFSRPRREDIVVLRPQPNTDDYYIKRVIGLPGEMIEVRSGAVYINGRLLKEPYATSLTYPDMPPHRISDDCYFVMGDNRMESFDSRHFDSIPIRQIEGRVTPDKLFDFF